MKHISSDTVLMSVRWWHLRRLPVARSAASAASASASAVASSAASASRPLSTLSHRHRLRRHGRFIAEPHSVIARRGKHHLRQRQPSQQQEAAAATVAPSSDGDAMDERDLEQQPPSYASSIDDTVPSHPQPQDEEWLHHHNPADDAPGLFSIRGLHRPSDFPRLARDAASRCDSIRASLALSTTTPPTCDVVSDITHSTTLHSATRTLDRLDAISNVVCSVIDAAELCRSVHPSEEWRDAASRSFSILSEYIADLNADVSLYRALRTRVTDVDPETYRGLTEEEKRMATMLRAEFERDGIHLEDWERDTVRRMQNTIVGLESEFSGNIVAKRKFFPLPAADVSRIIPPHVLSSVVPQSTADCGIVGDGTMVTVSSDAQIANTLLRYSPNADIRKEVYLQSNTACPENLDVLDELVRCRHEHARMLGFRSYADKFLRDKMAKNQDTVYGFLGRMSGRVKEGAAREMELLRRAKRQVTGEIAADLEPWDVPFYTGLLKSQLHDFDASSLAPYFSVQNCIEGMKILCGSLFGIRMEEAPLHEHESWSDGVQKLTLSHETEGLMGTIYLDLHPRPGKYVHAAHFTIQCGCAVPEDENEHDRGGRGTVEYQSPVVALVCNLSSPNTDGVSQLSHSEVETLFHEFGHALHSLLSRTRFQHLSGTRAAVDFVETPSHLMEHFVLDGRVLELFARHAVTGEAVPRSLTEKLSASRGSFQCIEIQNQVLYALLDQELFGVPKEGMSSTDVFRGLHQRMGVPFAEGTHWHSRFGHLVTYGGGYYGYLYDQVFAADIWNTSFKEDPLDRTSGERLRKDILVYGGAKDPHAMLRNMLGRDPSVESFFAGIH